MGKKLTRYHKAKSGRGVTFVYFDIGGVLLNFWGSIESLANVLNAPMQDVYDFWEPLDDALNRGTLTAGEFWQQLKAHFRYQGQDIDVVHLWVTGFHAIKESHAFVRKLSRTRKIGILSNAMPGAVTKARKLGHIPRARFAAVIESHAYGITKPDPEIFALAQKQAGVAAGEILFIDDREINLKQAHKSGFHTYLFDPENPAASVAELEKLLLQ